MTSHDRIRFIPFSEVPMSSVSDAPMNPGDDAPPGTPGTGEDVCPVCHGSGQVRQDSETVACANCGGSGVIVEGIGGG
jgi:hypothetical protein